MKGNRQDSSVFVHASFHNTFEVVEWSCRPKITPVPWILIMMIRVIIQFNNPIYMLTKQPKGQLQDEHE
jgi:hypothetical protein